MPPFLPSLLAAASKKLGTVVGSCVHSCFSFSIQKSGQALCRQVIPGPFLPKKKVFLPSSTMTWKLWHFFFYYSPISVFNRADDHFNHKPSLLQWEKSPNANQMLVHTQLLLPGKPFSFSPFNIATSYAALEPQFKQLSQGNHFPSACLDLGPMSLLHSLILALPSL